jgi:hypothetical protein
MNPEPNAQQPQDGDPVAAKTAQHITTNSRTVTRKQRQRKREYEKQFPLLRGFCIGNSIAVPCPFCDRIHTHGWDPKDDSRTEGLRIAHCGSSGRPWVSYRISPFRQRDLERMEREVKFTLGTELPLTELARISKIYAKEKAAQKARRAAAKAVPDAKAAYDKHLTMEREVAP